MIYVNAEVGSCNGTDTIVRLFSACCVTVRSFRSGQIVVRSRVPQAKYSTDFSPFEIVVSRITSCFVTRSTLLRELLKTLEISNTIVAQIVLYQLTCSPKIRQS